MPFVINVFLLLVCVSLWFIAHLSQSNVSQRVAPFKSTAIMGLCLLGVVFGLFRVSLWNYFHQPGQLATWVNKKVELQGIVTQEPAIGDDAQQILVEVFSVKQQNATTTIPREVVQVTVSRYIAVSYADEVTVVGKLAKPGIISTGETSFNYGEYLRRKGVSFIMSFPQISVRNKHRANKIIEYLYTSKEIFLKKIDSVFIYPQSGLLAGLLVSGRASLSKQDQQLFIRAGVIHIVALSGFNVTVIAQALMILLIWIPKRFRLILSMIGVAVFVVMTGSGATIIRAGIMAELVLLASISYRTYQIDRALFIAALCMMLWSPYVVFDVSFQLSFLATFALVFMSPIFSDRYGKYFLWLPEKYKIREIFMTTFVIEIVLVPILLYTTGVLSFATLLSNILILPMLPFVMLVGSLTVGISFIVPLFIFPFSTATLFLLNYIFVVVKIMAALPLVMTFQIPLWSVFVLYGILSVWFLNIKKALPAGSALKQNINEKLV